MRRVNGFTAVPPFEFQSKMSLVVGISFDEASTIALRRARTLSRDLGLELVAIHVLPIEERAKTKTQTTTRTRRECQRAKTLARRWALDTANIALAEKDILILSGDPAEELVCASKRLHANLLVLGAPKDEAAGICSAVIGAADIPVLIARPRRAKRSMVVATDLTNRLTPVVTYASNLAKRLQRRLMIVHNVAGVVVRGVNYPLPERLREQSVTTRLQQLGELVQGIDEADEATITREVLAVDGILRVARRRDVDLIIIGARPNVGGTSKSVLSTARRSVLTVPLVSTVLAH